jgi:hypothetical protein
MRCGYRVEDDVVDDSASVVYFPVEEEYFSRGKEDVSMWEQLELAAQVQKYWADNSVSVTVTFNKREREYINVALQLYESRLKSVSFLPLSEHSYKQAPYQEITREEYESYVEGLTLFEGGGILKGESKSGGSGCDGEGCLL